MKLTDAIRRSVLPTAAAIIVPMAALSLSACSTSSAKDSTVASSSSTYSESELQARAESLLEKEARLKEREAQLDERQASSYAAGQTTAVQTSSNGDLLPPAAKTGECYARVWVEPTYSTVSEQVLVSEESVEIDVIPAQYETVQETVEVQAASYRVETIPARYESVSEQILVKDAELFWTSSLGKNSRPVNQELLDTADKYGVNLDSAQPGQCFREYATAPQYETVQEQVVVQEAFDEIDVVPAEYGFIEKEVLVREASSRLIEVPAKYETVTEQVIDKPAHTIWKKGTGPIQKIDSATGEIMCLVEVPATYRTVSKRVLVSPATTRVEEIPAEYKTVKVKQVVNPASESRRTVPAKYDTVTTTRKIADASFLWAQGTDKSYNGASFTGKQICLNERPAQYKTVTRRVVAEPASTRQIEIPAVFDTVTVTKLVKEAEEVRRTIPAEYRTVTSRKLEKDGHMQWRSILCETNMTRANIRTIQSALKERGYNPGPVDGVIGSQTIQAMNAFQRDNDIPTDEYINIQSVKALGINI